MINVLIADDHPIVRKGLKQICEEFADIRIAGEAGNGKEILEKLSSGSYDVILLDISLPDRNGIDMLKEFKAHYPRIHVLMLSIHPEEQYALIALRAGASGYLTKKAAPDELVAAIRKVARGERYISPLLAEELAGSLGERNDLFRHRRLSAREYQVMCLLAQGKMVKEIASELTISEKTVSTYRIRMLSKMQLKGNVEITRYAIDRGLLSAEEPTGEGRLSMAAAKGARARSSCKTKPYNKTSIDPAPFSPADRLRG